MAAVTPNGALRSPDVLEAEMATVVADLYELFAEAVIGEGLEADGLQAEAKVLERYIRRVGRIGMAAGANGHGAFKDACVEFLERLRSLARRGRALSAAERELLEAWPTQMMACLGERPEAGAVEAVIALLQSPAWTEPLSAAEAKALRAAFRPREAVAVEASPGPAPSQPNGAAADSTPTPSAATVGPSPPDPPAPAGADDLVPALQQELAETMDGLFADLQGAGGDTGAIAAALQLAAERTELMGMSAADAGFMGLMDVCLLFQAALHALAESGAALDKSARERLAAWNERLNAYLAAPSDAGAARALLDYLADLPWGNGLDEAARAMLEGVLLPELGVEEPVCDDVGPAPVEPEAPTTEAGGEVVLSEQARELIGLLSTELEFSLERLDDQLTRALDEEASDEARVDALGGYLDQVEPFALAAESLGLTGLSETLDVIQDNLKALLEDADPGAALAAGLGERLRVWPTLTLSYLHDLGRADSAAPLIALLVDPQWPRPVASEEAAALETRLARPELLAEDEQAEPRQRVANADDVSLALPEDVNPQLLDSLLQELPNETAEFTDAVSRMSAGGAGLDVLERAQRIAHTLKGSANTVGVAGIAKLTHHIEDILVAFSKQQRLPGSALLEVLIDAADVLEMMSEALVGTGPAPGQARDVLQRVLDWANRIDAEGLPEDDAAPPPSAASGEPGAGEPGPEAAPEAAGATLRVPARLVDELLRLAGESIILTGQLQDRLGHALRQTEAARDQNRLVQQLVNELEELVDVQGLTSPQARAGLYEKFDALELDQYNELHSITHRLAEASTDARELTHGLQDHLDALAALLVDQGRLHKESQEVVMHTRMVPVQTIVPRLQRSVRQTGRLTGKQARLEVRGADTLIDSDVLNELADPLMHILRNAVDHGIEPPESRRALGKDPAGCIELGIHREGDQIVLRCRDDGAGLDLDSIRQAAKARGLLEAQADADGGGPAEETGDEALMRLVWLPGFSTREVTTQTSGRGIGMDAVYSRITELKGSLGIDSQRGEGCTVELRLPVTLISVHALLVRSPEHLLAVSTRGVEQILHPGDGAVEHTQAGLRYRWGESSYEAYYLETLLHQPIDAAGVAGHERPVLLVRGETGRTQAVLVCQIAATQDLVVKQLGRYVPPIAGIEGATILGDGSIAPVVDLPGLLRTAAPDAVTELAERLAQEQGPSQLPCALVVDDSLSARRSLAQFVQDAGFEVRTARDGLEAIDAIAEREPDVLLVDLEMPRMNGLELTAHVRARSDLREVPIIMITSRATDKHRHQAEEAGVNVYLTKPFTEDELLGHIAQRLGPL